MTALGRAGSTPAPSTKYQVNAAASMAQVALQHNRRMMGPMKTPEYINSSLLDRLTCEAVAAPRGRKNLNFHPADSDPCNRLLNAIEPGSYVAPHRHNEETKDETFLVVRGRLALFFFDDAGRITEHAVLGPKDDALGVNIPHGVWHSAIALESGTVFFEAKAGPYVALTPDEKAAWAPTEGAEGCADFTSRLKQLLVG